MADKAHNLMKTDKGLLENYRSAYSDRNEYEL